MLIFDELFNAFLEFLDPLHRLLLLGSECHLEGASGLVALHRLGNRISHSLELRVVWLISSLSPESLARILDHLSFMTGSRLDMRSSRLHRFGHQLIVQLVVIWILQLSLGIRCR